MTLTFDLILDGFGLGGPNWLFSGLGSGSENMLGFTHVAEWFLFYMRPWIPTYVHLILAFLGPNGLSFRVGGEVQKLF